MAPLPRDVLVARLLRVFGARGGACSGRVKRFDEWPDQVRNGVLQAATNGDAPFLLYLAPTGDWTAVSLREVLSSASGEVVRIPLSEIVDVAPPGVTSLDAGRFAKKSLNKLVLSMRDGTQSVVHFEAGGPCFGLWNMLLSVICLSADA